MTGNLTEKKVTQRSLTTTSSVFPEKQTADQRRIMYREKAGTEYIKLTKTLIHHKNKGKNRSLSPK